MLLNNPAILFGNSFKSTYYSQNYSAFLCLIVNPCKWANKHKNYIVQITTLNKHKKLMNSKKMFWVVAIDEKYLIVGLNLYKCVKV